MLDVHPPHHPVHAWRDFFVHIATIVIGLLIAVGLEQTVEAFHRHHERDKVIEEMRSEAERNQPVIAVDIERAEAARRWARQSIALLASAPTVGGFVTVTLPLGTVEVEGNQPSRAVWDIAKANGKAALIPDDLAELYDRQKWEADGEAKSVERIVSNQTEFETFEARLQTPIRASATLHLAPADRDALLRLLAGNVAAAATIHYWLGAWQGAAEVIAQGGTSRTEIEAAMERHRAAVPK